MSKNRKNTKGTRRGNARTGRGERRHLLNVRTTSKKGSRVRWNSRWRLFAKWGSVAAFVLFLMLGVQKALDHFLYESPKFKVAVIDYQTDGYLTRARVLEAAGVEAGKNILRVDLESVRAAVLAKLPVVKEVEVVRDLPDRLGFKVEERSPITWLADIDRIGDPHKRREGLLLDAEGVVVPCDRLEPHYIDLPVIFSDEYPNAKPGNGIDCKPVKAALGLLVEAGRSLSDSPVEVDELHVTNSFSLLGRLNTGAEITFGLDDFGRQMDDLKVILAETSRRGRALATANVMVKKNIPVRFVDGVGGAGLPAEMPAPRAELVVAPAPRPRAIVEPSVPATERPAARNRVFRRVSRTAAADDPAVRSILRVD